MTTIQINSIAASWDNSNCQWVCDNKDWSHILNNLIPESVYSIIGPVAEEGGREGLALKELQRVFGEGAVKVLVFEPEPARNVPGEIY